MRDLYPRDFPWRDLDHQRPEPGRASHSSASPDVRDRATSDPRDVAVRHVDLPTGPTREPVRVRDRDYAINGSQSRMLATVGAFRVVSARDLEANRDRDHPRAGDLRHLRDAGLVEMVRQPGHKDRIVTLTEQGRELLEAHRRPGEAGTPQAFYAGVRKPRELRTQARVPTLSAGTQSRSIE